MNKESYRILYRPSEAFELLGLGRSTGYALIASGAIPSVRIGRAVRIPADALREWIEQKLNEGR